MDRPVGLDPSGAYDKFTTKEETKHNLENNLKQQCAGTIGISGTAQANETLGRLQYHIENLELEIKRLNEVLQQQNAELLNLYRANAGYKY